MDNLVWIVYLIGKLNSILWVTWVSFIVLLFLFVLRTMFAAEAVSQREIDYWESFGSKRYSLPAIVLLAVALVTPNESSAYKIMAVYGGVELLQTDEAKKLSSKSLDVLNKVMDDYLDEPKEN